MKTEKNARRAFTIFAVMFFMVSMICLLMGCGIKKFHDKETGADCFFGWNFTGDIEIDCLPGRSPLALEEK